MNICIISYYFLETTLPLAKRLINNGHKVTVYTVLYSQDPDGYVIKFPLNKISNGILHNKGWTQESIDLNKYLSSIKIIPVFINGSKSKNLFIDIKTAYQLSKEIRVSKYEAIHLIGNTFFFYYCYLFFGSLVKVHTLHEVTSHEKDTRLFDRILMNKIKNSTKTQIIVHSEISKERLLSYFQWTHQITEYKRIKIIPFGLFETYNFFASNSKYKEDYGNYILFWGRFTKYKGIDILLKAFHKIDSQKFNIKLIIAGSGKWEYGNISNPNIVIINKHLSNEEIVNLNKNALFIVCPYTSASQSGITKTTFLFNKPIIATKVGAFCTEIQDGVNGYLIQPNNPNELTEKIIYLINNTDKRHILEKNIAKIYSENNSPLSWENIAYETLETYKV